MKRYLKYIVFLLVVKFGFSQRTRIEISNLVHDSRFEDRRCDDTFIVTAFARGMRPVNIIEYRSDYVEGSASDRAYLVDGIVTKIEVYMRAHDGREIVSGFPPRISVSCGSGSVIETNPNKVINVNPNPCQSQRFTFSHRNGGDFEVRQSLEFDYKIIPLPKIERTFSSDIAGYDDPLTVRANTGYNNSVYNWEYGFQRGTRVLSEGFCRLFGGVFCTEVPVFEWFDLNVPNRNNATVIPNTFLDESQIGQRVFFRVSACDNRGSAEIVDYLIKKSAPRVVNYETVDVSCYDDSEDGSVKITFNRPLEPGDNFNIAVTDRSILEGFDPDGNRLYASVKGFENLTFDGTNSVVLDGLPFSPPEGFGIGIIAGSGYNGETYFTDGSEHTFNFSIDRPTPVTIDYVTPIANFCNDGDTNEANNNDGAILIKASGGAPGIYQFSYSRNGGAFSTWTDFNAGDEHRISGVIPDTYQVKVQKLVKNRTVACIAHRVDSNSGVVSAQEAVVSATVGTPAAPLQIENITEEIVNPKADGFTDGQIKVRVFGGTKDTSGNYNIIWRNIRGQMLTTSEITKVTDGSGIEQFFTTLSAIGEGVYFLTVTDANYIDATAQMGCFIENHQVTLTAPEPLVLSIDITKTITCNAANTETDADKDGELTAIARGGVVLPVTANRGLEYYYTWKKKNPVTGLWEIFENRATATETISNLSEGEYAVNIEDANGIIRGIYVDNVLQNATDVTKPLNAPEPISIIEEIRNVSCYNGNDGFIHLTIEGGTGTYTIEWQDDFTAGLNRDNLVEGTYRVRITDVLGCMATKQFEVVQPTAPLALSYPTLFKQPTAFGLTNGWIEARVSGGTALPDGSYPFVWTDQNDVNWNANVVTSIDPNTNAFVLRLETIGQGYYTLRINDANYTTAVVKQGCTIESSFQLEEPKPLTTTITEDQPISCHPNNVFGNSYNDGVLTAHARGGIRFSPGLPYIYTWKKQQADGSWALLTTQTDSIAANLDDGVYAVNIEDANGIVLGRYENNILVREIDSISAIRAPDLLEVVLSKQDVYCNSGNDGWVEATITGGTAPYSTTWNTEEEDTLRIENLSSGTYDVIVTDDRGCEAVASVVVAQPETPIEIKYPAFSRPSFIGASDAWITAEVSGGTSFLEGHYVYRWTQEDGELLNVQTETEILPNGNFSIRLNAVTAGNYYLTIEDANHSIATTKVGCTYIESLYTLYEPIEAVIEEHIPISCSPQNEFLDPYSDGAIVGHVRGGVPFSNGLPYQYIWKKQNNLGIWDVLPEQTDSIATNLEAGRYALNATDSRGNVMGIYESAVLIQAIDSTYIFTAPTVLEVALSATAISCDAGNDGSASVAVSGGTPPYNIEWSTGARTATINDLISGTYIAFVTDARGCKASGTIFIEQPGGILVKVERQKHPTCYSGNDGEIALSVTGGTPPYSYQWDTGENGTNLSNLSKGVYTLTITDREGCKAFEQIKLEDPLQIPINLGENRTICINQTLELDIAIEDPDASYQWVSDTGFNSTESAVTLTKAGQYTATITNALGCTNSASVTVGVSNNEIIADFVLTTQAYAEEEVILVNVSYPKGDTVIWNIPEGVEVKNKNDDQLVLTFTEAGNYDFGLRSYVGDCYADFSKTILVGDAIDSPVAPEVRSTFIQEILVYPNPSKGKFNLKVTLAEEANIQVNIINLLTGSEMSVREAESSETYLLDYDMSHLPSGVYLLTVETPRGNAIRKIVIE